MDIKPIETVYNGYRFRSRLEARWAVFFDAAGIKYEYEPEGFEADGVRYLPDFYLPELDDGVYVEVKSDEPSRYVEIIKASSICIATRKVLLVLSTIPNITDCGMWMFYAFGYNVLNKNIEMRLAPLWIYMCDDGVRRASLFTHYYISYASNLPATEYFMREMGKANFPTLSGISVKAYEGYIDTDRKPQTASLSPWSSIEDYVRATFWTEKMWELEDREDFDFVKQCYEKARQARFEHGETPTGGIR